MAFNKVVDIIIGLVVLLVVANIVLTPIAKNALGPIFGVGQQLKEYLNSTSSDGFQAYDIEENYGKAGLSITDFLDTIQVMAESVDDFATNSAWCSQATNNDITQSNAQKLYDCQINNFPVHLTSDTFENMRQSIVSDYISKLNSNQNMATGNAVSFFQQERADTAVAKANEDILKNSLLAGTMLDSKTFKNYLCAFANDSDGKMPFVYFPDNVFLNLNENNIVPVYQTYGGSGGSASVYVGYSMMDCNGKKIILKDFKQTNLLLSPYSGRTYYISYASSGNYQISLLYSKSATKGLNGDYDASVPNAFNLYKDKIKSNVFCSQFFGRSLQRMCFVVGFELPEKDLSSQVAILDGQKKLTTDKNKLEQYRSALSENANALSSPSYVFYYEALPGNAEGEWGYGAGGPRATLMAAVLSGVTNAEMDLGTLIAGPAAEKIKSLMAIYQDAKAAKAAKKLSENIAKITSEATDLSSAAKAESKTTNDLLDAIDQTKRAAIVSDADLINQIDRLGATNELLKEFNKYEDIFTSAYKNAETSGFVADKARALSNAKTLNEAMTGTMHILTSQNQADCVRFIQTLGQKLNTGLAEGESLMGIGKSVTVDANLAREFDDIARISQILAKREFPEILSHKEIMSKAEKIFDEIDNAAGGQKILDDTKGLESIADASSDVSDSIITEAVNSLSNDEILELAKLETDLVATPAKLETVTQILEKDQKRKKVLDAIGNAYTLSPLGSKGSASRSLMFYTALDLLQIQQARAMEKVMPSGKQTFILYDPSKSVNTARKSEYSISEFKNPIYIDIGSYENNHDRFYATSPCKTDMKLTTKICTCKVSSGSDLLKTGDMLVPVENVISRSDQDARKREYLWDTISTSERQSIMAGSFSGINNIFSSGAKDISMRKAYYEASFTGANAETNKEKLYEYVSGTLLPALKTTDRIENIFGKPENIGLTKDPDNADCYLEMPGSSATNNLRSVWDNPKKSIFVSLLNLDYSYGSSDPYSYVQGYKPDDDNTYTFMNELLFSFDGNKDNVQKLSPPDTNPASYKLCIRDILTKDQFDKIFDRYFKISNVNDYKYKSFISALDVTYFNAILKSKCYSDNIGACISENNGNTNQDVINSCVFTKCSGGLSKEEMYREWYTNYWYYDAIADKDKIDTSKMVIDCDPADSDVGSFNGGKDLITFLKQKSTTSKDSSGEFSYSFTVTIPCVDVQMNNNYRDYNYGFNYCHPGQEYYAGKQIVSNSRIISIGTQLGVSIFTMLPPLKAIPFASNVIQLFVDAASAGIETYVVDNTKKSMYWPATQTNTWDDS